VVYTVEHTITLAEINAGHIILVDAAGVTLKPVGLLAKVNGLFEACSSVDITDNAGSPVNIASLAVAQLTNGAALNECSAGVTLGAGFLAALTAGKGLKVSKTGSAATTGTSITFRVLYTV